MIFIVGKIGFKLFEHYYVTQTCFGVTLGDLPFWTIIFIGALAAHIPVGKY